MNEPVLPETRVGFYIQKASSRRLDAMPLPILRDPSKSNPAHPWKYQQVWKGAQESGQAVFGKHGSFLLLPETHLPEGAVLGTFLSCCSQGWRCRLASRQGFILGCFQNGRKRRKTIHSRSDHRIPSRPEEPGNKASFSE